jgi:hypothetical protein
MLCNPDSIFTVLSSAELLLIDEVQFRNRFLFTVVVLVVWLGVKL